ncbi:MAG: cobalamin biosynthesis protein CbiG [uncultured archaeon A07HN63]|nr:MAG: cobalamin biosynthesis protein CbiG [uncultured archaeon A07HN63]
MSTDNESTTTNSDTSDDSDSGGHCSTPDSDGEVAEEIAIISFGRKMDTAEEIESELGDRYEAIDIIEYHGEVFDEHWGEYDCFVGLMASGIAMRKTAHLLDDKWDDPAICVVDEELTWAIPITGGHHGANQVAQDLATMGAIPAMTTASRPPASRASRPRRRRWTPMSSTAARRSRQTSPCWMTNSAQWPVSMAHRRFSSATT